MNWAKRELRTPDTKIWLLRSVVLLDESARQRWADKPAPFADKVRLAARPEKRFRVGSASPWSTAPQIRKPIDWLKPHHAPSTMPRDLQRQMGGQRRG